MWSFSTGSWLRPVLKWHPYIYNTAPAVPPHLQFSPPPRSISPPLLPPVATPPPPRLRADAPSRLCLLHRDAGPSPPRKRAPPISTPAAGASSRAHAAVRRRAAPGPLRLRLLRCPGPSAAPPPRRRLQRRRLERRRRYYRRRHCENWG